MQVRTDPEEKFEKHSNNMSTASPRGPRMLLERQSSTHSQPKENDTLLKAKDVLKFCQMTEYEMDWWYLTLNSQYHWVNYSRVVDHWNIHRDLGFNGTIHCYWNNFDDRTISWSSSTTRGETTQRPGLAMLPSSRHSCSYHGVMHNAIESIVLSTLNY